MVKRARELDPLSLFINTNAGERILHAGHVDEATEELKKTIAMATHYFYAHLMLGNAYLIKSEFDDAVEAIEKAYELSPGNLLVELHLALAHYLHDNKQKGDDLLKNLQEKAKKEYVPASYIVILLNYFGESDQAYEWFKKACGDRDFMLPFGLNWPLKHFDIPDEKRFHDLIEKMWAKP